MEAPETQSRLSHTREGVNADPSLDYVSPLPPVRSGIADYSLDLLPHLEALCEVRVVRLPGQPVAPEVEARWRPVGAEALDREGRLPLYQMGNNRYHEGVLRLALVHPGVLTLHDLVLHHLLLDRTIGRGNFQGYREELARDHGWVGEMASLPRRWWGFGDAAHFSLPAHRTLLRRQRGVLVHSRWAADRLREEDPEIQVRAVPMGVPLPPPVEGGLGRAFRRRLGIPERAPVLASVGFQTQIKRTGVALAALARPELVSTHLLVVGEMAPDLDFEAKARQAGVRERVHILGFVDTGDFQAAIAAADLCLNLRYPTAGETSASLLRILAMGRPAMVSDYAQFAELPEEIAVKVPLGEEEIPALAGLARRLLQDPGRLQAMGWAARRYVMEHHDPGRAARAVVDACREWREAPPPGDRLPDVPRPTSLLWRELPGELEIRGVEAPWPAGERRRLRIQLWNRGFARWLPGETGPGGVAVEVGLLKESGESLEAPAWLPLPREVGPGEGYELEMDLRRPPGSVHLRVEPHVLGRAGFNALGGPVWEGPI